MAAATRLTADVGGTNTRVALYDELAGDLRSVATFVNQDYDCLEDVLQTWRDTLIEDWPQTACIAAAAPPSGDQISMINLGWSFSCAALAEQFGFSQLRWLNDFQANAHSLPYLGTADLEPLHPGEQSEHSKLATVGPGTGLGGATLQWVNGTPIAIDAEPGHAGLSPGNELETELFRRLLPEHGDVYAELLVSGAGLVRLYTAIAELAGEMPQSLKPADVSRLGLEGEDRHCIQALETFCALLGSACGDFVLSNGAYGGLYIAGGIMPRMTEFLRDSDFLKRLQNKGLMSDHLARMPVQLITTEHPGLIGAAHAPLSAARES
ncbi:MAG: glucokinase [Halioglobus sp.]